VLLEPCGEHRDAGALVAQRRAGYRPPLVERAEQVHGRNPHIGEEHLGELGVTSFGCQYWG
jgi:hypothetical protein